MTAAACREVSTIRSPTARHGEAPSSTTSPKPGYIYDAVACAVYRYATWGASAALALLIVLVSLAAVRPI